MDFSTRLFTAKGDLSTMRVIFVGVAVLVIAVPMIAWAGVYMFHNEAADIPSGVVTLASLVFLTVTGGKYLEKREEVKVNVAQANRDCSGGAGDPGSVDRRAGQEDANSVP